MKPAVRSALAQADIESAVAFHATESRPLALDFMDALEHATRHIETQTATGSPRGPCWVEWLPNVNGFGNTLVLRFKKDGRKYSAIYAPCDEFLLEGEREVEAGQVVASVRTGVVKGSFSA